MAGSGNTTPPPTDEYLKFLPEPPEPGSAYARYREDSWEAWHYARDSAEAGYIPSPAEIDKQLARMKWLEYLGFNEVFISSVMIHDTPSFALVCEMVRKHGVDETYRRCRWFLHY